MTAAERQRKRRASLLPADQPEAVMRLARAWNRASLLERRAFLHWTDVVRFSGGAEWGRAIGPLIHPPDTPEEVATREASWRTCYRQHQ